MLRKYNMSIRLILCVCFLFFNPKTSLGSENRNQWSDWSNFNKTFNRLSDPSRNVRSIPEPTYRHTQNQSSNEKEVYCRNFQEAIKCAVRKVGVELLEKANKVTIGNLGDGEDHVIGVEKEGQGEGTKQNNFKIRVDWDPVKGNHLNVEKGCRGNREKIAYIFPQRGHEELHELRHALKAKVYDSFDNLPEKVQTQNGIISSNRRSLDSEKRNASKLVEHFKSFEKLTNYPSEGGLFRQQSGFENPRDQHMRNEILVQLNNITPENSIKQQSQVENASHENGEPGVTSRNGI